MDNTYQKSFMIYRDWRVVFERLDEHDRSELLMALFAYADGDEAPELSPAAEIAFLFMSAQLGRDRAKWEETCERRAENGRKGGAPKGNKNASKQPKQAKRPDTDTETKKEKDTDMDTVNDTVTEKETEGVCGCAEGMNDRSTDCTARAAFGSARNVHITADEYQRLCREYTKERTDAMIERLSRRIEQGASYASCFAVLVRDLCGDSSELSESTSDDRSWDRLARRLPARELLRSGQPRLDRRVLA